MEISVDVLRRMISKVLRIQSDVMSDQVIEIDEMTDYDENLDLQIIGFDSLCFINLIVMLEEEYQIEFSDSALALVNMNSISQIKKEVDILLENRETDFGEK